MTIQQIHDFVRQQKRAVVATIGADGKPRSSVGEFCEQPDMTIIIHTHRESEQYQRLTESPHVAIVIGGERGVVVQLSAVAHELSGAELTAAHDSMCLKQAQAAQRRASEGAGKGADVAPGDVAYFACAPTWIRYSDLNQDPWYIEEFEVEAQRAA